MFPKLKALCRIIIFVFVAIGLVLALAAPQTFAYNWPWDQGHDSCDPDDPRWGTSPETCDPCCDCKKSPVFVKSGDYLLSFNDFTLKGIGPLVAIGRSYNSRDMRSGPLGRGWTFNYGVQLIPVTDDDGNKTTIIRLPNGQRIRFTENPDGTFTSPFGVTSTLVRNGDGTYTLMEKNGTRHEFDADGKLTAVIDRNNNQLSFSYDVTGCLNGVTDASGRSFDIAKNANGKISSITDPVGRTYNYEYDGNGNLIRVTNPLGNTTTFGYDAKDRLTSITDARGNVIRTITYDDLDRVISYSEGGETYTMEYLDGQTNKTDSYGNVWQFFYDDMGMVNREIDPLGNEVTNQHNSVDPTRYDWQVDANGNRYEYTYDERGNQTSITDPLGSVTTYTYEPNFNQVETKTDARGVITKYEYDANGNLIKVTRAFGTADATTTTYTYDQSGNQTSMTDGNGNTWTYTYDANGNLLTETDPLGNTTTYTYDAAGNVLSMTDANGNTTSYQYDDMNHVIAETDPLGNTIQRAYDENGNLISETDKNGNTTLFEYDAYNRLIKTTDPLGNITTRTYDTKGNLASVTDANGKVTYYKYDALSRRTKMIQKVNDTADVEDDDDVITQYVYDGVGNLISLTDPNGNTATFAYDAANRLASQTNPLGETTTFTYDAVGNKLTETSPNGNVVSYSYDNLNRVVNISDSVGVLANYTYDAVGNLLTKEDANGNVTTYEYNESNRTKKIIDAMGEEISYSYDNVGNLLTITDREGNMTSNSYDAVNRKISSTNALGNTTSYQYDNMGNPIRITDANGNITRYEYDGARRLIRETYADNTVREFTYDGVGNILTRLDPNGSIIRYEYDDLYRLTKRDYPDNNDDTFTYDKAGRMLTATNLHSNVTFAYDQTNRITQTIQDGHTVSYAYDIPNNQRTITYPDGKTVTETFDMRDRLADIDESLNGTIVQYAYDNADRLLTKTYSNGVVASYNFNNNNWLTRLTYTKGAAAMADIVYDFDREGSRRLEEKLHDPTRSKTYSYDAAYQVTGYKMGQLAGDIIPTPTTQTTYDFDPLGNWNSQTTDGVTEVRSHNEVNEITDIDGVHHSYDANGNLVDDGQYTYTYDYENRLTQVTRKADGQVLGQYQYDALGRRVFKKVFLPTVQETHFVYSGWLLLAELDAGSNVKRTYIWGADLLGSIGKAGGIGGLVAITDGVNTYFCLPNGNGDVIMLADATTGAQSADYDYSPFGKTTKAAGSAASASPFRFSTKYTDAETGLIYYGYRYYSPTIGRWLTRDPIEDKPGLNLYVFVDNNAVSLIDPIGMETRRIRSRRRRSIFSDLNSDWAGRAILWRYLKGGGDWTIEGDPKWTRYMKGSGLLKTDIRLILLRQARKICPQPEGYSTTINITKHMEVDNGEGIIGYQYLHGTNARVGDFKIKGTATRGPGEGLRCCTVIFDLHYQWNDIIDPNPKYTTDKIKSFIAEIISLGNADAYTIRIGWQAKTIYRSKGKSSGWPFN